VGREAELAQLYGWFEKALQGERQLIFVTGEPGIGKTCILDEFARRVTRDGAVVLQGGCHVSNMREGEPVVAGTLKIWNRIGKATGAQAISLRILEFGPGLSPGLRNAECDEVLYMPEGPDDLVDHSTLFIDGQPYKIAPQTGIYIRPGQTITVENRGSQGVLFVGSQCPEPVSAGEIIAPLNNPSRNS